MFNQALEHFQPFEYNKRVLFAVWALVLSKCFILEYYIEAFDLPINSIFYIWALSLSVVSILTFLYLQRTSQTSQFKGRISIQSLIGSGLFAAFLLINLIQYFLCVLTWAQIMAINITLLGIYFATSAYLYRNRWDCITALFLIFPAIPLSLSPYQTVNLYTSFLLIILAIQLILDLIHYRKNSIHPE
ncbi:MAG: hypothetical protein CML12_04160 [Puniceicoccaceae bacterium]|nr:hypothetical protein [Puniceicoccaceae bacterium]|tara:strand:- start:71 stop:634 length:564 start_codon:yes stop_codon:yes gene_type:complete